MIALLAAGEARRYGGGKLDAPLAGRPLGRWAVEAATAIAPVVVIVPDGPLPAFLQGIEQRIAVVANPDWTRGPNTSLMHAVNYARIQGMEGLLIHLADMPLVSSATLAAVLGQGMMHGMAATRYPDGRPGVPACFMSKWFDALQDLPDGRGAKTLLRSSPGCHLMKVPAYELIDIDTPGDLGRAEGFIRHRLLTEVPSEEEGRESERLITYTR
ncbi:nucleotidyltransferase family protein [Novosphingobium naphthalenivorans]|uniref:nucleotidyltransferase family protein n=1 Tax=Novosphingobium naphthalenivorans TaxID=273168 RepID=UPI0008366753|nr:nucleotidyltransferase family protein [Novosphingobium naphthalenivorans]